MNDRLREENLELLEEDWEMAHIRLVIYKERLKKYFDKQVCSRDFQEGNLDLRKVDGPRKEVAKGKMAANWEWPYQIAKSLENGAHRM